MAFALAGVAWFGRPRPYRHSHARWIARAASGFALPAAVALAWLGRWDSLWRLPVEFTDLAGGLPRLDPLALLAPIAIGLSGGIATVALRIGWARRRGRPIPPTLVRPAPLAARSADELFPATAVAVTAGVTEELAFRLAIPLLVARLTGSALAGFALGTALFVALHRYQSWPGLIGVTITAAVFTVGYLATGALWLVMLVHAAIDVIALAVRPWLAGFACQADSSYRRRL